MIMIISIVKRLVSSFLILQLYTTQNQHQHSIHTSRTIQIQMDNQKCESGSPVAIELFVLCDLTFEL